MPALDKIIQALIKLLGPAIKTLLAAIIQQITNYLVDSINNYFSQKRIQWIENASSKAMEAEAKAQELHIPSRECGLTV